MSLFSNKVLLSIVITFFLYEITSGQDYNAGFKYFQLKDSTRIYKPDTKQDNELHYRPVDLDVWYPSTQNNEKALKFGDLFGLFEQRANNYQDDQDYSGITQELAQFYFAELGLGTDSQKLLDIETNSFLKLDPIKKKHPIVIYFAGFNGMGFENYKILEKLAQNGFLVVSIWSVGRYPGEMTNQKEDMLEQVYDAEFAIRYLKEKNVFNADFTNLGLIGYSWGGMSSATFLKRNPNTKAFVSFDGTETHYFGEDDENDQFIREIYDSKLLNPKNSDFKYLYLESGDKLNEFEPSRKYDYFQELDTEKYYLCFKNSQHIDFSCIPSILEASAGAIQTYSDIEKLTLAFFNKSLKDKDEFQGVWKIITTSSRTSLMPYNISKQTTIDRKVTGIILDSKNNEPLSYVNIGFLNREIGTVTDKNGEFSLDIIKQYENDTLRISSIGYKPIEILAKELALKSQPVIVQLEELISELDKVVITAKTYKRKNLGNKTKSKFMSTGYYYDQLGTEMGVKINIRKKPTLVDAFNFNVTYNKLNAKSTFRINFYSVENNKPKENILNQNIFVSITPKDVGNITVDLKPYDIVLTEDVIITLEWIENKGDKSKDDAIFFSLGMFNSGTLHKKSSQGKFQKHSGMGIGFNVDVRY
ncbi:carboxypeptidase-like regulatory domain-containing protein [Psychroserpens sp. BH13MA-6]